MYLIFFKEIQNNYIDIKLEKVCCQSPNVASSPQLEQWVDNCTDRDNNVKVKKFYTRFSTQLYSAVLFLCFLVLLIVYVYVRTSYLCLQRICICFICSTGDRVI